MRFLEGNAGLVELLHYLKQISDALGSFVVEFVFLLLVVDDDASF